MDRKKFFDLLKNLQTIMRCPSCGALYDVEEIQYVGNQDGYFLLSMTCSKCSLPVWVNFFAGSEREPVIANDLTITDSHFLEREPISSDEVLDFHTSLKSFSGDFKKAFKVK
ncbi:MAG: hypothetical protein PHW75_00615 [Patescibacteria group bacterium]|nr:hypothetical protein [Patescibacteria group bacterium]